MNITSLLLLIILIFLQYSLWLNKNGIYDYYSIKNSILERKNNNKKIKIRNNNLYREINILKKGEEAIEERARYDLGMIKSNEIFYRLVLEKSRE
ncbi:cell division protein FtsB [Candidatus Schneideria nysicola]|uniref:cell division protein FtsB n=1 Tax=Candidatus Schneideria nysicola TaxID=1081631 RepID=UPI001CAA4740|nr:cell division protein FtsB [Candidatus Schneideria nysicola]UAJ65313.1 cell division protein FtsB [Candidatus Schneideria nysicola]